MYAFLTIIKKFVIYQENKKVLMVIMYIIAFISTTFQYTIISFNVIAIGIAYRYILKKMKLDKEMEKNLNGI